MRALKTEGENTETQDVQFTDKAKSFPFGIAVFDNSQINHLYHTETLEMKFKYGVSYLLIPYLLIRSRARQEPYFYGS